MSWWVQLIACFVAALAFSALVNLPKNAYPITGLIAAAGFSVLKISLFKAGATTFFAGIDWLAVALFIVLLVLTQVKKLKKIHPIAFIAHFLEDVKDTGIIHAIVGTGIIPAALIIQRMADIHPYLRRSPA